MAVRIQFRRGTAAEWSAADPTLAAGELGYETDTAKFKIGNGTDVWEDLEYAGVNDSDIQAAVNAVIDGAPDALNTLNELAAALDDDSNFASATLSAINNHTGATTNVHGIANTALLVTQSQLTASVDGLELEISNVISDLDDVRSDVSNTENTIVSLSADVVDLQSDVQTANNNITDINNTITTLTADVSGLETDLSTLNNSVSTTSQSVSDLSNTVTSLSSDKADLESPSFTGTVVLPSTTSIGEVSATEIGYLNNVSSAIQTQLNAKAAIDNPEFTGTVILPSTTSIGGVSAAEISYLNNVTSAIQTQIDGKLDSGVASTTYAALAGAQFTGNVALTANTSIGTVDATEISYLNGVTSSIQDQLDDKAPIESPTFTGTVSGITATMVGLGDVDNTSDLDKPISTATQTALDTKASLSGAIFTGNVEVDGNLVVDGDLTVNGNSFTASSTTIVIEDNIVQLAHQNAGNTVDLGLVVGYNDGATKHAGIVKDVSDSKWKLFKDVSTEPTTTVAFGEGSLDDLAVNNIEVAGVVFSDGTQTKQGVPSITTISQKTDSYTLSSLGERDTIIEISKSTATTLTIPTNATVAYPVGTTLDVLQTGSGQVTIAGAGGVTVNATPGLKLRTQWSSATLLKRGENSWVVYGDLTA